MAQRKRANPFDQMKRELPFVARIKAGRPWTRAERGAIDAAASRIGRGRWHAQHGWREDHGWLVFWFATPGQACELAAWANENGMHREPPTREERIAEEAEASRVRQEAEAAMQTVVDRALAAGVCQKVVQAYRRAIWEGKNAPFAGGVAHAALIGAWPDRPQENTREHAEAMVKWAQLHHGEWFDRCRPAYHRVIKRRGGE